MRKNITLSADNYNKLGGIKTTSIRLGVKGYQLGEATIEHVGTKQCTRCFITKLQAMTVGDLDHRHAIRDGFHSLGELHKELRRCYGSFKSTDLVTVVTFKL